MRNWIPNATKKTIRDWCKGKRERPNHNNFSLNIIDIFLLNPLSKNSSSASSGNHKQKFLKILENSTYVNPYLPLKKKDFMNKKYDWATLEHLQSQIGIKWGLAGESTGLECTSLNSNNKNSGNLV